MDIIVLVALIVGLAVCLLPGVMAWSYYASGHKVAKKRAGLKQMKAVAGHTY